MLLQHEDLEQIVDYTTGMYRLLFRTLLGPGVVCGLDVNYEKEKKCFSIEGGVALDCDGYVVEVSKAQMISFEDVGKLPEFGLVILKRRSKTCATRGVVCNDGEDTALPTREMEGFEIVVVGMKEDPWNSSKETSKTPFKGNECPGKCCDMPGVLLASFSKSGDSVALDKDRRQLRDGLTKEPKSGASGQRSTQTD
jgi:hypothetical protein